VDENGHAPVRTSEKIRAELAWVKESIRTSQSRDIFYVLLHRPRMLSENARASLPKNPRWGLKDVDFRWEYFCSEYRPFWWESSRPLMTAG